MKVRLLLAASLFMALFAALPLSANAAPALPITRETIRLLANNSDQFPSAHGTATYKIYVGGGRSLEVNVAGLQYFHEQTLIVGVDDQINGEQIGCSILINAFGRGGCYVDTRLGATVPLIQISSDHTGSELVVFAATLGPPVLDGHF